MNKDKLELEMEIEVKVKEIEAAFYAIRKIALRAQRVHVDDAYEGSMDVYKAVHIIRSFCDDAERKYEELIGLKNYEHQCGD